MDPSQKLMRRCIEIADACVENDELPFGSLLALNNNIVIESGNMTNSTRDVTNHAEILVLRKAQSKFGKDLSQYALYSNCEPCAMCAFMIRELRVGTVVFGTRSPIMGGYSQWDILQSTALETLSKFYGKPPRIIGGYVEAETDRAFPASEAEG